MKSGEHDVPRKAAQHAWDIAKENPVRIGDFLSVTWPR